MGIGLKKFFDNKVMQFYKENYNILRTPDFNDESRFLNSLNNKIYLGNSKYKICRFCGKNNEQTKFSKIAHVFPESIGNHILFSNYECDLCNQFFGDTIENDYAKFFLLYHSILGVNGKKGIPCFKYKVPCNQRVDNCAKNCVEFDFSVNQPMIRVCENVSTSEINLTQNKLEIKSKIGNYSPIGVYKALVKMALTVMPIEELGFFNKTINWLLEKEHRPIRENCKLIVRYKFIPGFNVNCSPFYFLYKRKNTIFDKPYLLFHLTYSCFSLLIEVPRDNDNFFSREFEKVPFPEIPFYSNDESKWNLTDDRHKIQYHTLVLNFKELLEV